MDDWTPAPLVDPMEEADEKTLATIPVIHGPNGLRVKLSPNGKTVSFLSDSGHS